MSGAIDPSVILRNRARELARPLDESGRVSTIDLLEFRVGTERYAVESVYVGEVYPLKDLAPLPSVPSFVRGIVSVRGRIVPVFDLQRLFDLPEQGLTDLHQVIVLEGNQMELGLLADAAVGTVALAAASLQPALPTLTGARADYLRGVTAEHLVVLDAARILADPRIIIDDAVDR